VRAPQRTVISTMPHHSNPGRALFMGVYVVIAASVFAITPSEWSHRQSLKVEAPGLIEIELPEATFDQAQPGLKDLRILDSEGREQSYHLFSPTGKSQVPENSASWDFRLQAEASVVTLTTETRNPLKALHLQTPNPHFIYSALVEASEDKEHWTVVDRGLPLFRQYRAEKLELPLGGLKSAYLRVTIPSVRQGKLTVTGVRLETGTEEEAPPVRVRAELASREEFAGETVFTLRLAASHLPLASLTLRSPDGLFMRRVSITVREARDSLLAEKEIGEGTVYRVSVDGSPARSELAIPFNHVLAGRELLVHVENGDSPPLAVEEWIVKREPLRLLFPAPREGQYLLLSGNPQAESPRYDMAAFSSELRLASIRRVVPGPIEPQPGHSPRELVGSGLLPGAALTGAPFSGDGWKAQRTVQITGSGVQELELPPEVQARSRLDFGDLRLVRAGKQLPYLLEEPALYRSLELTPVLEPDAKQATRSRWKLKLPQAGFPLSRLILQTRMTLFARELYVYEVKRGPDGQPHQRSLADARWRRTPEETRHDPFSLHMRVLPETDCVWLETDNGDNAPLDISEARAVYPVVRLLFNATETDGYVLYHENPKANSPRYDLSLIARTLYTAPRKQAVLSSEEQVVEDSNSFGALLKGGALFWAALGLVVASLLFILAKMLPKAKA